MAARIGELPLVVFGAERSSQVLHAHVEALGVVTGEGPSEQRRAEVAKVEVACG